MNHNFGEYFDYISRLPNSAEEKAKLTEYARFFEKQLIRMDFQMKRTLKDKSIIINLLNKTIEDLRSHQDIIVQANQELSHQKSEIELKNQELISQKQLVEEQSLQLVKNLQELEMSYNELEQFSYIASHDLKSPLRTIASYAGLLKRRYVEKLDAEAIEFIDYIVNGAGHMNDIIRDLLEFASSGKGLETGMTNLNETLALVKQNLRYEINESGAQINYVALPCLEAHQSGVLQLFQNLVANAIKFRQDNIPPEIQIRANREPAFWHFEVEDNGLGLDESYHSKVFQPFQRVNTERPGTGMGLAICKKIVKAHQGEIWYHSRPGVGTVFHFTLRDRLESGIF